MTAYDQHKAAFDRDGFVVIRQPLSSGEFDELVQNVQRYRNEVVPKFEEGTDAAMYGSPQRPPDSLIRLNHMQTEDTFFEAYARHDRWVSLAETMLGEPVTTANVVWFNKPPRTIHPNHPTPIPRF